MYESQVSFTLDTVCPWTCIAKKRLDKALAQVRATSPAATFTLHFEPYQLDPNFPTSVDKQSYSLHHKHNDNPAAQQLFQAHMRSLGEPEGITFNFDGTMGNTLHAHRVIQYFQDEKGAETANRLVDALYRRYFQEARHPAADETLIEACVEAGIGEDEAREVVEDRARGERQAKEKIRSMGMDIDAVPVVVVEGRRRDVTLTGAKEVEQYVKALETIIKEST
ncbi:Fc.00g098550.m01.CDS01 [Cosmosporella sp. VM-42]